jgi:hypothetical protein
VIDDVPVILALDAVDLHRVGFIDQVEQGRKGIAKAYAAPTAMADIEDAFELVEDCGLVIKTRVFLP